MKYTEADLQITTRNRVTTFKRLTRSGPDEREIVRTLAFEAVHHGANEFFYKKCDNFHFFACDVPWLDASKLKNMLNGEWEGYGNEGENFIYTASLFRYVYGATHLIYDGKMILSVGDLPSSIKDIAISFGMSSVLIYGHWGQYNWDD